MPWIKEVCTAVTMVKKQGVAFRRCGWSVGCGRPPALSGLLQSEGVCSTRLGSLGRSYVTMLCLTFGSSETRVMASSHAS